MTISFIILFIFLALFMWMMCKFIKEDDWEWVWRDMYVYIWDLIKRKTTHDTQTSYTVSEFTSGIHYLYRFTLLKGSNEDTVKRICNGAGLTALP